MTREGLETALRLGARLTLEPIGNPLDRYVVRLPEADGLPIAEIRIKGVNSGYIAGLQDGPLKGLRFFLGLPTKPMTELEPKVHKTVFDWLVMLNDPR